MRFGASNLARESMPVSQRARRVTSGDVPHMLASGHGSHHLRHVRVPLLEDAAPRPPARVRARGQPAPARASLPLRGPRVPARARRILAALRPRESGRRRPRTSRHKSWRGRGLCDGALGRPRAARRPSGLSPIRAERVRTRTATPLLDADRAGRLAQHRAGRHSRLAALLAPADRGAGIAAPRRDAGLRALRVLLGLRRARARARPAPAAHRRGASSPHLGLVTHP